MRDRRAVLRRYAPLAVVLAVQAVFVALLPSTADDEVAAVADPDGFVSPFAGGGDAGGSDAGAPGGGPSSTTPGSGTRPAGGGPAGGGPAGDDRAGGGAPGTAPTAPGGGGRGEGAAAGDTSHCVDGRQFDPAIDYFAPPCVPAFVGENPGATALGVTADEITVVIYVEQSNPAVEASLRAQGLFVPTEERRRFVEGVEAFVNQAFELYGRSLDIVLVEGGCSTIPPDDACLRQEMRSIVAEVAPFAFLWISPLTSAPFDELSNLGVVNLGGQMFMDSFSQARAPFHWDVHMSGTEIARHAGEWWCKQLSGRPAAYSASPSPDGTAGNTNGRERVLGVIGTNDRQNILMREELDRVLRSCGDRVFHTYDASNDLSTAAAQRAASVSSMRQEPEATTVLCLCNPVGAQFVYSEMQQQNYYPEIVYAGTVYTDLDDVGQTNMRDAGCPVRANCPFELAFGLSSTQPREPVGRDRAARMWSAAGMPGQPPYAGAELEWDYWLLLASLLQGAGPELTPTNLEAGAVAAGLRGGAGTGNALRGFEPGVHSWNRDMAISWWDADDPSPFNGEPGTFVRGERFRIGQYASTLPSIPVDRG